MTEDERRPTFDALPVGALFRFFDGGSLLTKTGACSYEAPQWGQRWLTIRDRAQPVHPHTIPTPSPHTRGNV